MQDMMELLAMLRERPDDPESSERLLRACVRYRKAFHTPYSTINNGPPVWAREVQEICWGPRPELDDCLDLSCYRLPEEPPEPGCCLWIQVPYIGTVRDQFMAVATKGSSGRLPALYAGVELTRGRISGNMRHKAIPHPNHWTKYPPNHLLWWPTLTEGQIEDIRRAIEERDDG
jgi:hypothetical protein